MNRGHLLFRMYQCIVWSLLSKGFSRYWGDKIFLFPVLNDIDLWPIDLKIIKSSQDIERTSSGLATDKPTGAKQYAPPLRRGALKKQVWPNQINFCKGRTSRKRKFITNFRWGLPPQNSWYSFVTDYAELSFVHWQTLCQRFARFTRMLLWIISSWNLQNI
jgi:hypothetical protein